MSFLPLPKDTTADAIRQAAREFDADPRRFSPATRFAVFIDGRAYPPKAIISLATGLGVSLFSGGERANSWLAKRGFEVKPLDGKGS